MGFSFVISKKLLFFYSLCLFFFLVNFSVGIDDAWDVWRLQGMDCCVIMLELVI